MEARDVTCEDDRCAEDLARGIVSEAPHVHAIEAWLRPRLVCRIGDAGAIAGPTAAGVRRR